MKILFSLTLATALSIVPMGLVEAQGDRTERVQFPSGTTGTTLTGQLGSEQAIRYILNAREGQFLKVSLRPDNPYTYYIIYVPGGEILYESSQAGNEYNGQLYLSGDHIVEVFYKGDVNTVGKYDIAFTIDGGQSSGSADAPYSISRAKSYCLAAVGNQVNNRNVSVISAERDENFTIVKVRVPGAQAPWQCNHAGNVKSVFYTGSEGEL
ncbi:hypothetical protein [Myxosarcina sp. GI1]|uniref:hypothetical protein n=1 Tax=Myxosarcina sp. GI1 TaxID=1541065 RepID=UPI0005667307|nr:hypothetical protein [Myxosarcina sp. GI1]